MPYLLNLIYLLLLLLASPWLIYRALRQGKYREGFAEKLLGRVPARAGNRPCVWFHAVSVGEVNLLAPLVNEIRRDRPLWECVVSTTTMTGYAVARKKYPALTVFYCPLDFSWAVRAAMRRVRPELLVLAELELWPNLVRAAGVYGARVAIVNGRLSERSHRGYRRLRALVGPILRRVDVLAAQNDEYARRFLDLSARTDAVRVTGSIKYDGAQTDRRNPATARLRELAGIGDDDLVFLAGSTQEGEEAAALAAYLALRDEFPKLRLIIVPRHPERFAAVAQLLDRSSVAWRCRGRLETEGSHGDARILLVDTVGELGAWWGTSAIAFVGGSLGSRGGQNMIEPAAYGAAVSFGPNTRNFRDIVAALLAHEAAVVVRDDRELTAFVRRCLADPEYARALGGAARRFVAGQLGATARTLELLAPLVDTPPSHKAAA
ncbi:MAG TPA: 3-deoxy-D-manno-octulosonic acid transferase [Pirellulales bacterium]|nr:3-deoxy-D-manno-octulosonic acid transferase [Pirellulales bacterium]